LFLCKKLGANLDAAETLLIFAARSGAWPRQLQMVVKSRIQKD
jgi:hypothetical protein